MATPRQRVCVAQVGAPHGVRGEMRLRVFAEDAATLTAMGPLTTEGGRELAITHLRPAKSGFVARVSGVDDRDAAAALRNARLYVDRARLPPPDDPDEWYHADLIGLAAETAAGERLGEVIAVQDFGAGDLLELRLADGRQVYVPFTRAVVPTVDVAGGRLTVDPPDGLLEPPGRRGDGEEGDQR